MTTLIEAVGEKHFLYRPGEPEGSRCYWLESGLKMAVFMNNPTKNEIPPKLVRLGLHVYHRSIFLVVNFSGSYFDMPYLASSVIEPYEPGYGIVSNFCVCDDLGIVRSLAVRFMTNKFSNAFIDANNEQVKHNYTQAQHLETIREAYAKWPEPKLMYDLTTVRDEGWTGI